MGPLLGVAARLALPEIAATMGRVGSGLVEQLAMTDGMKRRAAAMLEAQSMDYDFNNPAVARVATNKSSMGVALANLYNKGGNKIPGMEQLGIPVAPNVGRVINEKSRMGRRLTEVYQKRNADADKKKSDAVVQADDADEKTLARKSVTHLESIDKKIGNVSKNSDKSAKVSEKTFEFSKLTFSRMGAALERLGKEKGSNGKLWTGLLGVLAGVAGSGDKDSIVGQLIDLLPDNIKEGFTGAKDVISGFVGKENADEYGPMIAKILAGGALAALLGFPPDKILGMIANISGGSDLAQGNFFAAGIKALGTGIAAAFGIRAATSDKGFFEQLKDDMVSVYATIKEYFGKALELFDFVKAGFNNLVDAIGRLIETLKEGWKSIKRLADYFAPEADPNGPKDADDVLYGRKKEATPNMSDWFQDEKQGDMADWYKGWEPGDEKFLEKVPPRLIPALRNALKVREKLDAQANPNDLKVSPNPDITPTPDKSTANPASLEDKNSRHNPIIIQGDTNVNNVNKSGGGASGPSGTQVNPGAGSAFDPYENFLQMSVYGFGS